MPVPRFVFLHYFALAVATTEVKLRLTEEFACAGGITSAGAVLHPHSSSAQYIIAGGPVAAAHCGRLGMEGEDATFTFETPVKALILGTYSVLKPVIDNVYVAPPPPPPVVEDGVNYGNVVEEGDKKYVDVYFNSGKVIRLGAKPEATNTDAYYAFGQRLPWKGEDGYQPLFFRL